jgi:hypothetical protein
MILRAYRADDNEALGRIHKAMRMNYRMPDLASPEIEFVKVLEQDGKVIGAAACRVVAETYVWLDPKLHPRDKLIALRIGQENLIREAQYRGWKEYIAMIPRRIEKKFRKRLLALQWQQQRTGWKLWGLPIPKNGAV